MLHVVVPVIQIVGVEVCSHRAMVCCRDHSTAAYHAGRIAPVSWPLVGDNDDQVLRIEVVAIMVRKIPEHCLLLRLIDMQQHHKTLNCILTTGPLYGEGKGGQHSASIWQVHCLSHR